MFSNTKLKNEISDLEAMLKDSQSIKGALVDFLGEERTKVFKALTKEKSRVRPREKEIYSLEKMSELLAMLQNRVIDNYFKK
jgi:hypothetical protein